MSKKSLEAFTMETEVLRIARERAGNPNFNEKDLREAFAELCNEYEKLVDEAKFLTKISDKLESKMSALNAQLDEKNKLLSADVDVALTEKEKALKKTEKLQMAKSEADISRNRLQMTVTIMIALMVVIIIMATYWLFFKDDPMKAGPHNTSADTTHTTTPADSSKKSDNAPKEAPAPAAAPKGAGASNAGGATTQPEPAPANDGDNGSTNTADEPF